MSLKPLNGNGVARHVVTAIITCCLTIIVMWFGVVESIKTTSLTNQANIARNTEIRNRDWAEVKARLDRIESKLDDIEERLPRK